MLISFGEHDEAKKNPAVVEFDGYIAYSAIMAAVLMPYGAFGFRINAAGASEGTTTASIYSCADGGVLFIRALLALDVFAGVLMLVCKLAFTATHNDLRMQSTALCALLSQFADVTTARVRAAILHNNDGALASRSGRLGPVCTIGKLVLHCIHPVLLICSSYYMSKCVAQGSTAGTYGLSATMAAASFCAFLMKDWLSAPLAK